MLLEKIRLKDDEKILKTSRQHWFNPTIKTAGSVFVIILPLLVMAYIDSTLSQFELIFDLDEFIPEMLFLYAFWILIVWCQIAYIWTDYYLDLLIVTNKRVIKIDQVSFFSRSIGSFRLERLQDINIHIQGLIATLLDFGDLEAETASASQDEFLLRRMPDPRGIKSVILEAADEAVSRSG